MNRVHNPEVFSLNATSSNKFPLTFFSMILLRERTSCCEPCSLLSINLHLKGSSQELHIVNIPVQTHLSWVHSGLCLYILWMKAFDRADRFPHKPLLRCLGYCCNRMSWVLCTKRILFCFHNPFLHKWLYFSCTTQLFVSIQVVCPSFDSPLGSRTKASNYLAETISSVTVPSSQSRSNRFRSSMSESEGFAFVFVKSLIDNGFWFPSMTLIKSTGGF